MNPAADQPIGVFDSGLGGLSVVKAIRQALPAEHIIYFGDNAHMPYGDKSLDVIRLLSERIVAFLLEKQCKMIVIACNTASAAALKYLREIYPEVIFVGMEPAVKPAAEQTATGVVGVIATTATFQGELFASVVERFAQHVKVLNQPCPGLVQQIEAGETESPETEKMLRNWLAPMQAQNMDTLVLACTHYPFVIPTLKKILGDKVRIIDPAPAIAARIQFLLQQDGKINPAAENGSITYYTSGQPEQFRNTMKLLSGVDTAVLSALAV
jgi:glutamate racemase